MLEGYISQAEAKGNIVSTKYYSALINVEKANIDKLEKEKQALLNSLEEAVNSGTIAPDSEAWFEMTGQIDEVTLAIQEANTSIIELNNNIRELEWQKFDMLQDRIKQVSTEANFLIELLSNDKLYDDNGQLTSEGLSTMGLYGQNYNTYMYQAEKYKEEMLKISKELEKDPYNQKLIERKQELIELQQESILAAEQEKNAIKDLVSDGIEKELSALKDLIDKYESSLDSAKDLYDYQKKLTEQTENIAIIEKQLLSYQGDNSEETKATLQKLNKSLKDAKENLQQTEYERSIEEQKKFLDDLYNQYEEVLNSRLDNLDALIKDMIERVNENSSIINDTLIIKSDEVGYMLSDTMQTTWGSAVTVLTTYGEGMQNKITESTTSLVDALNSYDDDIKKMIAESNKTANSNVQTSTVSSAVYSPQTQSNIYDPSTAINANKTNSNKSSNTLTSTNKNTTSTKTSSSNKSGTNKTNNSNIFDYKKDSYPKDKLDVKNSVVDRLKYNNFDSSFSARSNYYSELGLPGTYTGSAKQNTQILDYLKNNGYRNGAYMLSKDELAWTQEGRKMEAIVRPSDGAILTPLAKNDSVLNSFATSNIFNFANDPSRFIRDNLNITHSVSDIPYQQSIGGTYDNKFDIQIELPNVTNYERFKYAMQHDKSFEKMVRAMTVDKMFGGSSLKKYQC